MREWKGKRRHNKERESGRGKKTQRKFKDKENYDKRRRSRAEVREIDED